MAQVFVVDRTAFFEGRWPQGFTPFSPKDGSAFLCDAFRLARFVDRPAAEANPAWKQWIPYCVITCGGAPNAADAAGNNEAGVLVVRRTKGQSEARLHGAYSIGIGGHVEPEDDSATQDGAFFEGALRRELAEELDLRRLAMPAPTFLGLLNDDSSEVGRVHAGLVYRIDLPMPLTLAAENLRIREIYKMHGGFTHLVDFAELWLNPPQFESWSQILVRAGIAGPIGGFRANGVGGQGG